MRKFMTAGTALALSLAFAATAQADTNVQSLTGDWSASNSTVAKTADGVHFGTYANGSALGGSVLYKGANGLKLSEVNDFSYTFNYRQAGNATGAAPYARIFLDTTGDGVTDTDVILDPSFCATVVPPQSTDLTHQMVGNSVRYDDDGCDGVAPDQQPWSDVVRDHGNDRITSVLVSQGNSTGTDVSAMLKSITFNGERFNFNVAPADGTDGVNGKDGVTTVIHDRGELTGDTIRTLHARKIQGKKFLRVRASLRGKRLNVHGRSIKVDLRGKTVGNYNVVMVAKYKAKSTGKIHTERTIRSLSIFRK
jgi:hypothetical protein